MSNVTRWEKDDKWVLEIEVSKTSSHNIILVSFTFIKWRDALLYSFPHVTIVNIFLLKITSNNLQ